MLFRFYILRVLVFVVTALIGSLSYYVINYHLLSDEIDKFKIESDRAFFRRLGVGNSLEKSEPEGIGCGGCDLRKPSFHKHVSSSSKPWVTENYKVLSKPKAIYTHEARENGIEGTVRLKVTLLASGEIGPVTPVSRLPFGLTEQAIEAARKIRFEPRRVDGVPQSVVVTVDYGFNIY
jgi:TonB family protein